MRMPGHFPIVFGLLLLTGCSDDDSPVTPVNVGATLATGSGEGQAAFPGQPLAFPIVAQFLDEQGFGITVSGVSA